MEIKKGRKKASGREKRSRSGQNGIRSDEGGEDGDGDGERADCATREEADPDLADEEEIDVDDPHQFLPEGRRKWRSKWRSEQDRRHLRFFRDLLR